MSIEFLKKTYGIGLTGGIATGKSTVGAILRTLGYVVIDADQLARQVVQPKTPGLKALVTLFGPSILQQDGTLHRATLGQIIFQDDHKRKQMEAVLHPLIAAKLEDALRTAGLFEKPQTFFYEAALLIETGHSSSFREVWCTLCSQETQLQRLIARDGRSKSEAERIISTQMPAAAKAAQATVVLNTESSREELAKAVRAALPKPAAS
jgi:dephospho-CoA kinase